MKLNITKNRWASQSVLKKLIRRATSRGPTHSCRAHPTNSHSKVTDSVLFIGQTACGATITVLPECKIVDLLTIDFKDVFYKTRFYLILFFKFFFIFYF